MAVHNGEKYLHEAVQSILNQTFNDFEFIIIDDCSNDQTSTILGSFKKEDRRIKLFRNKKNIGLTNSLNFGLEFAKGKYIARMDADDISHSDRFAKQFQFLESNPQIGLLGTATEIIDKNGCVLGNFYIAHDDHLIRWISLFDNPFTHSSWMLRKNTLNIIGKSYNDLPVAQDYALASEIIKISKVANLPDFLIKWREVDNQISETKKEEQFIIASSISQYNINDLIGFDFINNNEIEILRSIIHSKESVNKNNYSVFKIFRIYTTFKIKNNLTKQEIDDVSKWVIRNIYSYIKQKVPIFIKLKLIYQCFIINPKIFIDYFYKYFKKSVLNVFNIFSALFS